MLDTINNNILLIFNFVINIFDKYLIKIYNYKQFN